MSPSREAAVDVTAMTRADRAVHRLTFQIGSLSPLGRRQQLGMCSIGLEVKTL